MLYRGLKKLHVVNIYVPLSYMSVSFFSNQLMKTYPPLPPPSIPPFLLASSLPPPPTFRKCVGPQFTFHFAAKLSCSVHCMVYWSYEAVIPISMNELVPNTKRIKTTCGSYSSNLKLTFSCAIYCFTVWRKVFSFFVLSLQWNEINYKHCVTYKHPKAF